MYKPMLPTKVGIYYFAHKLIIGFEFGLTEVIPLCLMTNMDNDIIDAIK